MRQNKQRMRGVWTAALLGAALLTAGCGPQQTPGTQPGSGNEQSAVQSFDDLANTDKLVLTTKADTDLPHTWTYTGEDARTRVVKLIPVLQQGKEMTVDKAPSGVPYVQFIFDVKGGKAVLNVYTDRFEFNKKWYALDNAPEATYGSVNELRK